MSLRRRRGGCSLRKKRPPQGWPLLFLADGRGARERRRR